MEKLRELLARRVRELMAKSVELNTQVKLSKRAGVSQSTVQRVLSGENSATLDVVEDLGRAFGFRPPSLLLADDQHVELAKVWSRLSDEERTKLLMSVSQLLQLEQVSSQLWKAQRYKAQASPKFHNLVANETSRYLHPDRINPVRDHLEKLAQSSDQIAAVVVFTVDDAGQASLSSAGLEPSHALPLLHQMGDLHKRLVALLTEWTRTR